MMLKEIIRFGMVISEQNLPKGEYENVNGPCCIEVPEWCSQKLGKFYLYFSEHSGDHIKLAYSDSLNGNWRIYDGGVLDLSGFSDAYDHIASPDIYIDDENKKIRLYFHARSRSKHREQWSYASISTDGINFDEFCDQPLAPFYLRVFYKHQYFYGMTKGGNLWRSKDGLTCFENGPNPFNSDLSKELWHNEPGSIRHVCFNLVGDTLEVYYSRIGDAPERIYSSLINVDSPDWSIWRATTESEVIRAIEKYEGGDLPIAASESGPANFDENSLRDPFVINYLGKVYMFYTVRGEKGIALCELVT
jgi:hypothetical protein